MCCMLYADPPAKRAPAHEGTSEIKKRLTLAGVQDTAGHIIVNGRQVEKDTPGRRTALTLTTDGTYKKRENLTRLALLKVCIW